MGSSLASIGQLTNSESLVVVGTAISATASIAANVAMLASGAAVAGPVGAIAVGCMTLYSLCAKKKTNDGLGQALTSLHNQLMLTIKK